MLLLWLYHAYDIPGRMYDTWYVSYVKHVVCIFYVRKHNDCLGINMNTKRFIILRYEEV